MAFDGIAQCFQADDRWFTGVVVTDGAGSPRDGLYADFDDDRMRAVRRKEQKKAAVIGEYAAQVLLDHPSKAVKDGASRAPVDDLLLVLQRDATDAWSTRTTSPTSTTRTSASR